ncbi:RuvX/YqgF family protein, partial [Streptomyces nigra]
KVTQDPRGRTSGSSQGCGAELPETRARFQVRLVDERMTTVTASQGLRASGVKSKKGRSVIDQAAAVIILQQALESERVSGKAPGEGVEVVI